MFRTILVPTDGSDHGSRAVAVASDLAVKHGARLILLHVTTEPGSPHELKHFAEVEGVGKRPRADDPDRIPVATPQGGVASPAADTAEIDRDSVLHELGKRVVGEAREVATEHGVEMVEVAIEDGDPAKRILDCARREGADAIVMGSRGRGGLKSVVFGSVSQAVCGKAEGTCIVVT